YHFIEKDPVLGYLIGSIESLGDYEMDVAVFCMAENNGLIVSVFGEQRLQIRHRLGQFLDREGDVFQNHRRAAHPDRPDSGKEALADFPEKSLFQRVFGELRRAKQLKIRYRGEKPVDLPADFL